MVYRGRSRKSPRTFPPDPRMGGVDHTVGGGRYVVPGGVVGELGGGGARGDGVDGEDEEDGVGERPCSGQ